MLEGVVWAVLGLILGSFTNVMILRQGRNIIWGRSTCPHCGRTLRWYELIPLLSFIVLHARCRTCRGAISWQYPAVELLIGILALIIGMSSLPLTLRIISIGIALYCVAIAVYDLYTTIIPDRWAYGLATLAFVSGVLTFLPNDVLQVVLFLVAGPIVALPLAALWFFSGGRWMGLGDAKLVLGFGWLVGLMPAFVALGMAFVIGAVVSVFILLPLQNIKRFTKRMRTFTRHLLPMLTRRQANQKSHDILSTSVNGEWKGAGFTMKSEVPFGPFLILSLCIVWLGSMYSVDVPAMLLAFLSLS